VADAASAALVTFVPAMAAPPPHGNQNGQQGQHGNQGNQGQNWQGGGPGGMGPQGGHGDRDWRDDRGNWHRDRDRYWRNEFRNRSFIGRDRVFLELRRHSFTRFIGDPYWFQGRFVVKTYDRFGRVVYVEVNPYTGAYIGVVRF
jgi:hypothetical protein